jgi:hypothetical protein
MRLPITGQAKLLRVEVIAVVLYTGPMVRRRVGIGLLKGWKADIHCVGLFSTGIVVCKNIVS